MVTLWHTSFYCSVPRCDRQVHDTDDCLRSRCSPVPTFSTSSTSVTALTWTSVTLSTTTLKQLFGIRVNNRDILHIISMVQLGLSTPAHANQMLSLNGQATGVLFLLVTRHPPELQADVTGSFTYYRTNSSNSSFGGGLHTNLYHYSVNQGTYGSTVTNQYGYFIGNSMSDYTNNYGFYSNVPGSSNYQFYARRGSGRTTSTVRTSLLSLVVRTNLDLQRR